MDVAQLNEVGLSRADTRQRCQSRSEPDTVIFEKLKTIPEHVKMSDDFGDFEAMNSNDENHSNIETTSGADIKEDEEYDKNHFEALEEEDELDRLIKLRKIKLEKERINTRVFFIMILIMVNKTSLSTVYRGRIA